MRLVACRLWGPISGARGFLVTDLADVKNKFSAQPVDKPADDGESFWKINVIFLEL